MVSGERLGNEMGSMNKKKICLVIPSLQAGGMERVMSELIWYFHSKQGIEVHLILYGIKRDIFYKIPDGIHIHIPKFRFNNTLRLYFTLKTLFYLRNKIRKIQPDSILSFGEFWNSFVLLALLGLNYPIFISDRCSPEREYNLFHRILRKWLYPKSNGIIVQSRKAKEIFSHDFNHHNICVIGNPIRKVTAFKEIEKENIILTVGRLISSKHHDRLIEIFIKNHIPSWKLVIVGYDHLKQKNSERLKDLINKYKANEIVSLEGKISNVEDYYLRSRIFAFTSSSEGFPNAIGEAMSAGLPVIAYDCVAGPSEMIKDSHNGFLVPLFDDNQFRLKLELLMKDDKKRIIFGRRGSEDIKEFSIEKIGNKFLNFILKD